MAFLLECVISDYEVRGVQTGESKKGKTFKSVRLESQGGQTVEVSTTDSSLFSSVDCLQKGDIVQARVRAVAGRERSYVTLVGEPIVTGNCYGGSY